MTAKYVARKKAVVCHLFWCATLLLVLFRTLGDQLLGAEEDLVLDNSQMLERFGNGLSAPEHASVHWI